MKAKYITPVVTAFDAENQLDIKGNRNIYTALIHGGVSGLLVMGSAGEFFTLTVAERRALIDLAVTYQHETKVIIGTGAMTTEAAIALSQYADQAGAENIILMSPYYFPLAEDDLFDYFSQIAQAVHCHVYLYNFPARTGYDLTPELTVRLLKACPNIVGYKDTVSDMAHTRRLMRAILPEFPEFEIFSGFDENYTRNVLSGGAGAIGALSNVFPAFFAKVLQDTQADDLAALAADQQAIDQLMGLYDIAPGFIPIIKQAMISQGIDMTGVCRSPVASATPAQIEQIKAIIAAAGLS
ncbi:MAG: dihydrodipicolinate synthase family protein [Lactobacillus sp.]|nr:dihydrodipicolinate synthase family protein [Lactobacillus sp.]MCI2031857.1 dihydrodipicolinate synthase family protein [Lactobacillus sp.]